MPEPVSEKTAITVSLGWLIGIIGLLMGLASSSGVLIYQVSELNGQIGDVKKQNQVLQDKLEKNRDDLIALTSTLRGQGVLR